MKNTLLISGETPVRFQPTVYQIIKYFHYVEKNESYLQDQVSTYLDAVFLQKIHEDCANDGVVIDDEKWIQYSVESFNAKYNYVTKKMLLSCMERLKSCGLLNRKPAPVLGHMPEKQAIYRKEWLFNLNYDKISVGLRLIQIMRAKGFETFKPKGNGKHNKKKKD